MNEHARLEVVSKAAHVEVGAAQKDEVLVKDARLGVEHAIIFIDANAHAEQRLVISSRGPADDGHIGFGWHHQAHINATITGRA